MIKGRILTNGKIPLLFYYCCSVESLLNNYFYEWNSLLLLFWLRKTRNLFEIEQKGMTLDHVFCYSFSFSSSLLILGGKRKREKNNQSRDQKSCLCDRSYLMFTKTGPIPKFLTSKEKKVLKLFLFFYMNDTITTRK